MGIHVLQLGPYPPPEGGITRNMLAIRDRLQERSDRCSIIATSRSTSIRGEIDVFHPRSAAELISLVRTIDHDVLHLHVGGEINKRVLSLCIAAATFGKRAVLSVHSGGFAKTHEASKAKPGSARALIFRRFAKIIAVNAELRDVFIRYGVSPGDVQVIAPFSLAPPEPEAHSSPRLAGFARAHTPFLLSVGGLEPDYEPLFLVDAMKDVIAKHPKAGLMIVGGGSMHSEVERAVRDSGLADSISLAGGVPHAETLHLIAQANALLRITLFDGDAISVREALFVGTPVIATENGMRPAGVRCISRGDKEGLVRNIEEISASRVKRPDELRPDHGNIDQVLALYDSLL